MKSKKSSAFIHPDKIRARRGEKKRGKKHRSICGVWRPTNPAIPRHVDDLPPSELRAKSGSKGDAMQILRDGKSACLL